MIFDRDHLYTASYYCSFVWAEGNLIFSGLLSNWIEVTFIHPGISGAYLFFNMTSPELRLKDRRKK